MELAGDSYLASPETGWVERELFRTPGMLLGYAAAAAFSGLNLLLAFTLYPPELLWNAFLHPRFGSLIWMGAPIFMVFGICLGVSFALTTVRAVRVEPSGISFRYGARTEVITWDRWRGAGRSLGFFGAQATYAWKSDPRRLARASFSRQQARVVLPALRARSPRT